MTSGAPWSVKGIDPKAREIAKDLARRSGMTLGEWLNQVILEDEATVEPPPRYPSFGRQAPAAQRRFDMTAGPVHDAFRLTDTLDRFSARIEAAEQRAASAISGINQSVAGLMVRLDGAEQDQTSIAARFEGAVDGLRAEQARAGDRLRRIEQEHETSHSKTPEALKALEGALTKVAAHLYAGEKQAGESFDGLRQELDGVHERLEAAFTEDAARELVETVITRLTARLEQAELRTGEALQGLETSFAALDMRLHATEAQVEDRGHEEQLAALAASLTERVEAVRAEMAENIRAAADDGRFERMEQALAEMTSHVSLAEQRSAGAIEKMGQEVLRMADTLSRSVQEAERRSSQAIEQVSGEMARTSERLARDVEASERRSAEAIEKVGGEVTRVAEAVEQRLAQADAVGAQALERLGGEITKIGERLTERIANAERRSAQAIDDVGDQVARVSERLQDRQDRASYDLSERIRLSEERTARLLEEARERIDQRLAQTQHRASETPGAPGEPHGLAEDIYADPAVAPFGGGPPAAHDHGPEPLPEPLIEDERTSAAGDSELFSTPVETAEEAFESADEFMEPARVEEVAEPFGDDVFAETHEAVAAPPVADDDDWLSTIRRESESHDVAEPGFEADDPFDLAAPPASDEAHHLLEPGGEDGFEANDELITAEPARPRTTRELIEQARAAARASPQQEAKSKETQGGSLFSAFSLGGKKKKNKDGSTLRTALFVSGGTAALGVALAGYVLLAAKPHGALPERVAQALGMQGVSAAHPAAAEVAPNPFAAVALAPKPIAGQIAAAAPLPVNGDGGAELYNDAVRRIEAKDRSGVAPLQKAANLGYAPAQFYLAKLYEDGQAGLPKDLVEARRWTGRAAEGGDRKAMHNLALYSFEGVGGPKNMSDAAQWFRRASDLGLVDSQYNLARLYEEGFGVSQNPAEAYKWYLIAARSGDSESRLSALRIKSQLSPEAQSAAERAADGFQAEAPQPLGAPNPAPQVAAGGDAGNVTTAQRALTKLGFYQGPADGSASPALKLAIAAYQRGQGLPASGQLDPAVNQRLASVLQ